MSPDLNMVTVDHKLVTRWSPICSLKLWSLFNSPKINIMKFEMS